MAKKTRYPRKLRMKMEKVASARDQREAQKDTDKQPDIFHTFSQEWLTDEGPGSVHAMFMDAGEIDRGIMKTRYYFSPVYPQPIVYPKAPWL